jgi:predicted alpha-1,2-mannosidase
MTMISRLAIIVLLLFAFPFAASSQPSKLTKHVDPFIGTDGFGHTFPGATTPFGMVQLSPDTRIKGWENCSGYHSSNSTIIGFSHTHLSGTGATDYGDIMFMATSGVQVMPGKETDPLSGYRSAFVKSSEKAKPGYYKVMLADYGIQAEMTATTRCGFQKYTFPANDEAVIIIDLVHGIDDKVTGAEISINNKNSVSGYRRSSGWAKDHFVFFHAEFSQPFESSGITDHEGNEMGGTVFNSEKGLKAWFKFKVKNFDNIMVKTGISNVGTENAENNLKAEIPHWDFNKTVTEAENKWESELSRIKVEGGAKDDKVKFYTALYHTMIHPNIMSDTDGRYRGMDGNIHKMERGNMYTVFSLWDTFRALHPLFTIIDTNRAQEFVRALLQKYKESKLLPVWELASNETFCMIGYHAVPVIVDAYMKGLRDFDVNLAYEAIRNSAMQDHLGLKYYKTHGYIPADKENEPVSKTLEYAYDDWCIAQMAKDLGKVDDYELFMTRSKYYLNVYDMNSGFMRARKNGTWFSPFDPYEVSGMYTEANAWQYTFFVPHDIRGMIAMMGGRKSFTGRLDSLFSTAPKLTGRHQPDISGLIGQYAHGNEPSHHFAYLYNYSDKPHRTAELNRKIMKEFYTIGRDGLIGNEDCGQMSAWFVFAAMGLYPVCPGNNEYEPGSPLFSKIVINSDAANRLEIVADSITEKHVYVKSLEFNGKRMMNPMNHSSLAKGGKLTFRMSKDPAFPYEMKMQDAESFNTVMIPYVEAEQKSFYDSLKIEFRTFTPGAEIYYTTNGTEPDQTSQKYTAPFYISQSTDFKIKAFQSGMEPSFTENAGFMKLPYRKKVTYTHPYSYLYTAGGNNGLVDGLYGEPNVFGGWQGFFGDDFEVVIDLGKVREIKSIESSYLQQYPAWIWLPAGVEYAVSKDGKNFTTVYKTGNDTPVDESGSFTKKFSASISKTQAQFVKVTARNIGKCPAWHPGAGEKAWVFVDEIRIE